MTTPTSHQMSTSVSAGLPFAPRNSGPPLQQQLTPAEEVNQKRHLRERHFTNYNEDFIQFDNLELDERPLKRGRTEQSTALPSISASHLELETAWAVVVNAGESILDEEEDLLPAGAHEQLYVQVRNIVVAKWREDVSRYLTEKEAVAAVGYTHRAYAIAAWRFLTKTGFINFGVAPSMSAKQGNSREAPKGTVIVVGAGMAGLAAARQLDSFGYRVIIVEGHDRPGGRVYTKQLKSGKVSAVADLGGSILTGIDGNPLAVLAKQLHIPLHVIDEADVPLYQVDGREANAALDQEVEKKWNDLLDECSKYRDAMGEVADNVSLGTALETLWTTMEGAAPPAAPKKRGRKKKIGLETAASDATDSKPADSQLDAQLPSNGADTADADMADAHMAGAHMADSHQDTVHILAATGKTGAADIKQEPKVVPADQADASTCVLHEAHHTNGVFEAEAADVKESPTSDCAVPFHNTSAVKADDSQAEHSANNAEVKAEPLDAGMQTKADRPGLSSVANGCMPLSEHAPMQQAPSSSQADIPVAHSTEQHKAGTDTVKAVPGLATRHAGDSLPQQAGGGSAVTSLADAAALSLQAAEATAAAAGLTEAQTAEALTLAASDSSTHPASNQPGDSAPPDKPSAVAVAAAKTAVQEAVREAMLPVITESAEVKKLKRQLLDWHMANLEFANAAVLRTLSMRSWDQDDPYEIQGSHCFLPGCNLRLVKALAQGLPILYNHVVKEVRYEQAGVAVTAGNTVIKGDAVIVTASLGVLKRSSIQFRPPLPERKLGAIKRLGFGVLNKVVMLFAADFWGGADMFGQLAPSTEQRGKFFLFYSYTGISGGPLLAALVSGEAAEAIEKQPAGDTVAEALAVLRSIFEPQGVQVPTPLQACCTRWGQDPLVHGSYSSVGVGSTGTEDYDIMAESIGDRLFFAGEGTTRKFPATMHGAFASGLREAANVDATLSRLKRQQSLAEEKKRLAADAAAAAERAVRDGQPLDPEFNPNRIGSGQFGNSEAESRAAQAAQLANQMSQVFDNDDFPPDAEFGCFQMVNGPPDTDFVDQALLRLDVGSIKGRGAPRRSMPVFFTLSQVNAQRMQDMPGGDEARVNFLTTVLGLQLVGRAGLTPSQQALVKALLAKRQQQLASLPLPPPPPRPQAERQGQYLSKQLQPGQHQGEHVSNSHAQGHDASQMPHMYHQPQHRFEPSAHYQQPPFQQQQQPRSWGSQEPLRYPGAKPAAGRGRPVYSAPYTAPYYAAQYDTPQQPPQQQQAWQGAFRPAAVQAPGQQQPGYVDVEHTSLHRHLGSDKQTTSLANSSVSARYAGAINQVPSHQTWGPNNHV